MGEAMQVTLGKLLEQVAIERPEHEAVVYPDRNLRYTYKQFDHFCRKVANGYMKLGIKKG
ncbi:hypothetical protein [Domibacillus sp. 8LH]|uniref:hypothetical protein n=1 Tax=Domibacillus sp. 8LH TaxID=3073900 RepID=UPI0034E0748D